MYFGFKKIKPKKIGKTGMEYFANNSRVLAGS
jgi:hypothetical protein